ncbi:MAG: glycine cleavage system aminomethyltransferase GcvT [Thermodesulfobacteriota bacterium]
MSELFQTLFHDRHVALGANMVEFGGWHMPLHYRPGILQEHLATRKGAGLFDVSHMGRFIISGKNAVPFLQHLLTNNVEALEVEESHYTIISNENGGAIDDAYLYRFKEEEYLLVVNAANSRKDLEHFNAVLTGFPDALLTDRTSELAMLSLQGPRSKEILLSVLDSGYLPEPLRNALSTAAIAGSPVQIGRTGYTGEPLCFELFIPRKNALLVWDRLIAKGAQPIGLGARDTLRLEAALPLYGHEFGTDPEGNEIPVFSCSLARFAVSFSSLKGDYIGRDALLKQFEAFKRIMFQDFSKKSDLPRQILPVALVEKGVPRQGYRVRCNGIPVGYVTSGTMVPCWRFDGEGIESGLSDRSELRGICLAIINSNLREGDEVEIEIRERPVKAVIVPYHLRSEAPPYARPISWDRIRLEKPSFAAADTTRKIRDLLTRSIQNTRWRQRECINLIPSEQTPSPMVRLLSITDPAGRYAEHKPVLAFSEAEVFYYQGTDFISDVENRLKKELRHYLNCTEIETRLVSGQMANTAVFSAMVDYLNRADRKSEQRRIRKVMNNHIIKGGHLSAQPMGALRDFVVRDPKTEKPAVVNFPVKADDPFKIDIAACRDLIETHRPELIIFGKSMTLYKEPVAEIRKIVDSLSLDCVILYDMAHVLGLVGPDFQEPFSEGVDIVTGSTHKTYFGTQRGIAASNYTPADPRYDLWEAVMRRAFPGSTSNHHLGSLVGLLTAAYEMNAFKEPYQKQIHSNAKSFAAALKTCGLDVAGDPKISFTQTHQVILNIGYAKGPESARFLEQNNIIVNYQAAPREEGFTAAGSLRMGVQEMTRFGMKESDFQELAQMMADCLLRNKSIRSEVSSFRSRFLEMKYCFPESSFKDLILSLKEMVQ